MVGSNGTMIAIRLVRSKLRKREDHQHHHHHTNSVHPEQVQQCSATVTGNNNNNNNNNSHNVNISAAGHVNQALSVSTTTIDSCCAATAASNANNNVNGGCPLAGNGTVANNLEQRSMSDTSPAQPMVYTTTASAEQFIWQFPPPYPPPNSPPPQYTLYNDQDTLVHGLSQADRQGFAKGFRKNLGGRWRRLVKRKPETETCAIPPELKDQLKTIYVY